MRQKVITIIRSFGEVLLWKPTKRPFYFEDKLRSVDVNGVVIRQTKKSNGEVTRVVIDKLKIVSWAVLHEFLFCQNTQTHAQGWNCWPCSTSSCCPPRPWCAEQGCCLCKCHSWSRRTCFLCRSHSSAAHVCYDTVLDVTSPPSRPSACC